ncbi:nectin-1-like isoform X1 [Xiphophorus couchianus]|uniref:nectin-1-like isoform X1 n=1 Tax=Xiphophorus couchianus TaxID=32473 RepID=UPI001016DD53|nr:nectin-1-like isoform X1 [Xiphophorus couchianus]
MFLITVSSSGVSDTSNQNQVTHSQVHVLPLNHLFSTLPTLRCRMEDMCLILSLFTLGGSFHKGLAVLIQTQQTVLAAVGEDAPLSCRLLETKDVQQVTWQKVLEKTERNIGSYSQYFGETVNPGFKDKVQFTEAGLQKNSIVIRNVTEQDAGCYLCLFNTYPDGALIAATCLEVYELHGPFIDVSRSNSPPGSDVTCSATGRPVPMVTLTVLHQNLSFSHYNTSTETNTNGTVTVTTKVLLSDLSSTQVGCSVSVDSAAPRELLVTVPEVKDSSDDGEELLEVQCLTDIFTSINLFNFDTVQPHTFVLTNQWEHNYEETILPTNKNLEEVIFVLSILCQYLVKFPPVCIFMLLISLPTF